MNGVGGLGSCVTQVTRKECGARGGREEGDACGGDIPRAPRKKSWSGRRPTIRKRSCASPDEHRCQVRAACETASEADGKHAEEVGHRVSFLPWALLSALRS